MHMYEMKLIYYTSYFLVSFPVDSVCYSLLWYSATEDHSESQCQKVTWCTLILN